MINEFKATINGVTQMINTQNINFIIIGVIAIIVIIAIGVYLTNYDIEVNAYNRKGVDKAKVIVLIREQNLMNDVYRIKHDPVKVRAVNARGTAWEGKIYKSELNSYGKHTRTISPQLRRAVLERDNYTCQLCGWRSPSGRGLHLDHIKPYSKGGLTTYENLQVLCDKCNTSKGCK